MRMADAVESVCVEHPSRFDCPDALVDYAPRFDEYGLIVHDGGVSVVAIDYCPWCATRLPESKRDRWFAELARLGFDDPLSHDIPVPFRSDLWWRT